MGLSTALRFGRDDSVDGGALIEATAFRKLADEQSFITALPRRESKKLGVLENAERWSGGIGCAVHLKR